MPSILFTNNAATTLASGITNVATSLTVAAGKGALFPTISGSDFFYATLANSSGVVEIVKVTARSTDTFTIVRGQDGTSAVAWNTGDKVELRVTAAAMSAMAEIDNNLSDLTNAGTARTNLGLGSIATQAASNVSITGGSITGITDLAVADGGTGASTLASGGYLKGAGTSAITSQTGIPAGDITSGTVATARLASGTASSSTYLRGDQTWATISGYAGPNMQVFTSSGTFTVPDGITRLKVTVIGGGGGAGGGSAQGPCTYTVGGAGGSPGWGQALVTVTSGTGYTVTVGGGGNGGNGVTTTGNGTAGTAGGTSSFSTLASATGGGGGAAGTGGGLGVNGANGSVGNFTTTGTLLIANPQRQPTIGTESVGEVWYFNTTFNAISSGNYYPTVPSVAYAYGVATPGASHRGSTGAPGMSGGGAGMSFITTSKTAFGGLSLYGSAGGNSTGINLTNGSTGTAGAGGGSAGGTGGTGAYTNAGSNYACGGSGGGTGGVIVEW